MPDLNSLPPSYPPSTSQNRPYGNNSSAEGLQRTPSSSSPRSSSVSLAAAARINAGIQNEESRQASTGANRNRPIPPMGRRTSVAMNLNLQDPSLPAPGEYQPTDYHSWSGQFRATSPRSLGSPTIPQHHQRAPSLGELHQELEQEQEAQVNRLLEMIRQQQTQLQQLQQYAGYTPSTSTAAVDDSTPTSERSFSFPNVPGGAPLSAGNPRPRSPVPRSSLDLSRQPSRRSRPPSHTGSPSLRPHSAGLQPHGDEWLLSGSASSRDDSAYYQAETQALTRENQMLRSRIRQLEQQLNEGSPASANTPSTPSNLSAPPTDHTAAGSIVAAPSADGEDKD